MRWLGKMGAALGGRTRSLEATVRDQTVQLQKAIEKHKEIAQFLRETLGLFRQVTENIADVFWVTNATRTKVEYVSPEFEKLWGEACATLMEAPDTWLARVHPEDRERVTRAISNKQVTGEYDEEYRVVRPDGVLRWVRDRAFPVKNENGAVYRLVGIAEDITDRKRTQQLLQAERDLGVALSSTQDLKYALARLVEIVVQLENLDCGGVYLMEPETGELELRAHRGLTESMLVRGAHYRADTAETRCARAGKPLYLRGDEILRTPQATWGGEGLRTMVLVPLQHKGATLGLLALASYRQDDISIETRVGLEVIASQFSAAVARIAAEESLRRSEAHLRSIVKNAPIALLAADARGTITFEDGQALSAMGFKPGEHLKQPVAEVFKQHPVVLDDIDRALAGEEFSSVVDFGPNLFENRYTPGPGDGKPAGFIAVAIDVTERSRLQRQILEISDREQARIGQDVHDGLCQQLIGAALKANALEQSLTTQTLPDAATARKICALLDEAITESRRVCRGLYPVRLKTEGLVPALEELVRTSAERYTVECQFVTSERQLRCDETTATHLYRITQEAVNNAVKHSRCRKIVVLLSLSGREIDLLIQDDGQGLKPAPEARTGMGLHIMDYRARSLGGRLRVNSDADGTTVSCRVPAGI
ncbi:MAG TPA: PAS domain S-box protein [Verrucomicrobiae bacterium]